MGIITPLNANVPDSEVSDRASNGLINLLYDEVQQGRDELMYHGQQRAEARAAVEVQLYVEWSTPRTCTIPALISLANPCRNPYRA